MSKQNLTIMSNLNENRLNTTISSADVVAIEAAINAITPKIPSSPLTPEQRSTFQGMDVDNKIFVEDTITELSISGTGIMPPFLNAGFIQNDLTLFQQLDRIESALQNLLVKVTDAKRTASHEAVSMSQAVYRIYVAADASGITGAKQAVDKLSQRYERSLPSGRKPDNEA